MKTTLNWAFVDWFVLAGDADSAFASFREVCLLCSWCLFFPWVLVESLENAVSGVWSSIGVKGGFILEGLVCFGATLFHFAVLGWFLLGFASRSLKIVVGVVIFFIFVVGAVFFSSEDCGKCGVLQWAYIVGECVDDMGIDVVFVAKFLCECEWVILFVDEYGGCGILSVFYDHFYCLCYFTMLIGSSFFWRFVAILSFIFLFFF